MQDHKCCGPFAPGLLIYPRRVPNKKLFVLWLERQRLSKNGAFLTRFFFFLIFLFYFILFLLVHRTSLQHCWHLSTRCLGLRGKFK